MTLERDLHALFVQGWTYCANQETLLEFPRFLHDLILGTTRLPKDPKFLYLDLHAHHHETSKMRDIIDIASDRVDILALTDKNREYSNGHLTLRRAREKLDEEGIEHLNLGDHLTEIVGKRPFYFVQGYETYVKENQGVVHVAADCDYRWRETSMGETIRACQDQGGFWFLDHPFSIWSNHIKFRFPTEEEMDMRRLWFDMYRPVIETGNHQNTIWMFPSNVLARRMGREYDLPVLANSDTHFGIKDIGLSRTKVPCTMLNMSSEHDFLRTLHACALGNHFEIESGYASAWSFGTNIVLPLYLGRFDPRE